MSDATVRNGTNNTRPIISVDLKKNRIRIHKATLHQLGDPGYLLLLVNPVDRSICICHGDADDNRSHRVSIKNISSKQSYELYSKSFIYALRTVCPDWVETGRYRIPGDLIQSRGMAWFSMADAVRVDDIRM